jgi:hypothetical protein
MPKRKSNIKFVVTISILDPYSFIRDPHPEVEAGDQYRSGSRALMTQNWRKYQLKIKLNFVLIKNCNFLIPRPP